MLKTLTDNLFSLPQYILPHHALSRLMHHLACSENRTWKNIFIKSVVHLFGVNMNEALETDLKAYASFNDFFTRALKPDVRPLCPEGNALICPADGTISQIGDITAGSIFQAKGKQYSALELLGGDAERARTFQNGNFATIYLSPRDYHRLHMPLAGTLKEMIHVPGRLFSVNAATANTVPNLFARNERVVALFETEAGPMALVLVGAIFVASIETVWHGVVTPPSSPEMRAWRYGENAPVLTKGEEMGRFKMGSTIIVLFGENVIGLEENLKPGDEVRMGQRLGRLT